ncbi:MAG: DRTGG domain-containing protein [Candidatus Hodarchaeales archaeon]|jgi:BioD-like phosphotransacetylase family protein
MLKKYIFVSNEYHAGKTSIILGIGLTLKAKKKTVGYFKPWSILSERISEEELIDPNLSLIKNTLKLKEELSELFGVPIPPNYLSEFLKEGKEIIWEKIRVGYDNLAKKSFDHFFVESHGYPNFGQFLDITHSRLVDYTKASPVIIAGMDKFDQDRVLDSILAMKNTLNNDSTLYCVINKIPVDYPQKQLDLIEEQLANNRIRLLGSIPESKILANPTVKDIFQRIQGQVIIPPSKENENRLVQDFLIGAMEVQAALPYLRKMPSKAVVTGGDRSDLILAAMETDTELLILTGTKYPESKVLLKARKNNIPILLVPYDTHTVIQQLDSITWLTPPDNQTKIDEAKKLIKKFVNIEELFE